MTPFYMLVFGKLADGLAKRRFARFIGWKFLRSQQTRETRRSRFIRSFQALARRPRAHRLTLGGLGLSLTLWALAMTRPSLWNTLAEAVSPSFATALHGLSLILGLLFLAVSLAALLYPTRLKHSRTRSLSLTGGVRWFLKPPTMTTPTMSSVD